MCEEKIKEIMALITKHLFKDCDELYNINMAQVFSISNLLIKSNIPYVLTFTEGTRAYAKTITLQIIISPTASITKTYQLEEGTIPS